MKICFEMKLSEYENLLSIIHDHIVKNKYESKLNDSYSEEEKKWCVSHGEYVEKEILNKIIEGIQK